MNACDLLTKDIAMLCERADVGLKGKGYIINRDDIQRASGNLIQLKAGATAYRFHQAGKQPFNGTNSTLVVGAMRSTYTHSVKAVIFDKEVVEMLRGGDFVVIVDRGRSGDENSNTSFEAFGLTSGMLLTEAVQDFYSEDTDAGWSVTLTEERASIGRTVYGHVGYQKALQLLESLCGEIVTPDTPSGGGVASVTGEVLTVDGSVSGEMLTLNVGSVSGEVLTI